jgi:type IV secretory pathway TraG/TraD family ATPase VirD4
VLQGFFHAAALTGRSLEQVLVWVADPAKADKPIEILERHPDAAPRWDGLLAGALRGSPETVSNTVTTVQQAMSLFFQPSILARCVPGPGRPATDIADIITRGGTIYLLGREDPYASASPLMTALGEHVLDTALWLATTAEHGRITPSFLACLDELPSTTPFPTLRVRMANERALGLAFIYAAQTWRQMVVAYGEDEARSIFGLTNNIIVFGGGKDIVFYREISDLLGTTRISRDTYTNGPGGMGTSRSSEDTPILRPEQIRLLAQRTALVIAESAPPMLVRLRRCIDGKTGRALLAEQKAARRRVIAARSDEVDLTQRTADAVAYAQAHRLHDPAAATPSPPTAGDPEPTAPTTSTQMSDPAGTSTTSSNNKEWSWQ